jgi:hypothetical protein
LGFSPIDWFFEEVYGAEFHGFDHFGYGTILTERYHRGVFAQSPYVPNQVEAVDFGHIDIDERDVVMTLMTSGENLLAIGGRVHAIPGGSENHF